MAEAISAGQEFDKGAELFNRHHLAAINLSNLGLGRHALDGVTGDLHAFFGDGVDVDGAVILDVDFATGLFDEPFDILAAGPDDSPNLLRVDLERDNARRILAQFLARRGQGLGHFFENMQAGHARFLDGFGHDSVGQTAQLEIELETGNPALGPGDLAIHVTKAVFPADDVSEQLVAADRVSIIVFGAYPDADAANRAEQRDPGVHQGQGAAAD